MTGAEAILLIVLLVALIAAYAVNARHYRKENEHD